MPKERKKPDSASNPAKRRDEFEVEPLSDKDLEDVSGGDITPLCSPDCPPVG
jgi:hypothetical protein